MMNREKARASFDVVRGHDPALYRWLQPETAAKYAVTRDWDLLDGIPSDRDPQPIVFHCKMLTRKQRRRVNEASTRTLAQELAFKYGVQSIRNAPGQGGPRNHTFTRDHADHALEDDALDEIEALYGIGDEDIFDIGEAVIARSFLAQGVQRECRLRDFSLEAARALIYRFHAERKKDAEEAASRESSEPTKEPSPTTPAHSDSSESAGDATATG